MCGVFKWKRRFLGGGHRFHTHTKRGASNIHLHTVLRALRVNCVFYTNLDLITRKLPLKKNEQERVEEGRALKLSVNHTKIYI